MKSPAHHDVAVEYAEYIQYVISRSIDYSVDAVLAFDNDFRNRVKFERSSLADSDCRRSVADRHFHAASRMFILHAESQKSRSICANSSANQQNASQAPIQMLNGIPICKHWNAGFCDPRRRCNYVHCCSTCFDQGHVEASCPNRRNAPQFSNLPQQ